MLEINKWCEMEDVKCEKGRECVSPLMREDRIIHPSFYPYEGV